MTQNLSALSFDMKKLTGIDAIEEMKASFKNIPVTFTSQISEQIGFGRRRPSSGFALLLWALPTKEVLCDVGDLYSSQGSMDALMAFREVL
jgi:hypothetical protein